MKIHILAFLLLVPCVFAETAVQVSNFDFEQQLNGWQNRNDLASADAAAARSGNFGLHVLNTEGKGGSSTYSAPFHVKPGFGYRLDFWSKRLPGGSDRTSVYVQVFNENGNMQPARETRGEIVLRMKDTFEWTLNSLYFIACKNASTAQLWIHSPGNAKVNDAFDDFILHELTPDETKKIPYLSYSGFPAPAPAKVWQVYNWLPDKPQGVGYPVTRRDKWDHLPNPTDSDKIIERAAMFMKSEPPELKDEDYMLFLEKATAGHTKNLIMNGLTDCSPSPLRKALKTGGASCRLSNAKSTPSSMNAAGSSPPMIRVLRISTEHACIRIFSHRNGPPISQPSIGCFKTN